MKEESVPIGGPPDAPSSNRLPDSLRPGFVFFGGIAAVACIALLILTVLACVLSKTPGRTLYYFFFGPFLNVYHFGSMLNAAVPLILGGLGVSVAMQEGSLNLGGEGQIYSGAFVSTVTALALSPLATAPLATAPLATAPLATAPLAGTGLGFLGGCIAVFAGTFFAGAMAALSGFFKARWKTNELITTFLLSNVLILFVNYLVNGPFLDPATSLQSTAKIPDGFRLPVIFPQMNVSAALLIALVAVIVVHVFIKRTRLGYEFRMAGVNEIFARYGGVNTKRNTVLAMFLSGALYGLAGSLAVFGTYYGTVKEFSAGMGWNGLAAALVAGFYPPAIIPASLFFAWISSGARIAMQNSDITFEVASVAQAVILFLATSVILKNIFKKKGRRL